MEMLDKYGNVLYHTCKADCNVVLDNPLMNCGAVLFTLTVDYEEVMIQ